MVKRGEALNGTPRRKRPGMGRAPCMVPEHRVQLIMGAVRDARSCFEQLISRVRHILGFKVGCPNHIIEALECLEA